MTLPLLASGGKQCVVIHFSLAEGFISASEVTTIWCYRNLSNFNILVKTHLEEPQGSLWSASPRNVIFPSSVLTLLAGRQEGHPASWMFVC